MIIAIVASRALYPIGQWEGMYDNITPICPEGGVVWIQGQVGYIHTINTTCADAEDIRATTGYYEFKPNTKPLHCFNLTAIDDDYIESIEYHEVYLHTVKRLDSIDIGVTIVTIFDNDGKPKSKQVQKCHGYYMMTKICLTFRFNFENE